MALGHELECTVLTSVLSSGGKEACAFSFRIEQTGEGLRRVVHSISGRPQFRRGVGVRSAERV